MDSSNFVGSAFKTSTLEIEDLGGKGRQIRKTSRTNLEYLCGISDFRAGERENI